MKIVVGNDIVENSRIREAYQNFGEKFLHKIYAPEEIEYCLSKNDPIPHLAARFACKEAFVKAIEYPPSHMPDMREIILVGYEFGKKRLSLSGRSRELFDSRGYIGMDASISHSESYSTAVVLLYQ